MTTSSGAGDGPGGTNKRQSFVDRDSHFSGTYTTPNDLRIEGHLDGTVECAGALIVAESADVNAHVTAGSISVAGHLQGDIGCRGRFEIQPTGRVEARVQAVSIVVHEGALYEGEMRMRSDASSAQIEDPTAAKRADARPQRRSSSVAAGDVPSFSVGGGRSNGRPLSDDSQPPSTPDGAAKPGEAVPSDD